MVFRINKSKDFTIMSNYHLQDPNLSLKAKGFLSILFSLPENWQYSKNGLLSLIKEGKTTLESVMKELKDSGYLKITQKRINGRYSYEYDIYEKPSDCSPHTENQGIENLDIYKELNNKELNNKKLNIYISSDDFQPPTLEEVIAYCEERKNNVDPQRFYDYYSVANWKDSKGQPIKNWKQKMIIVWEKDTKEKEQVDNRIDTWTDEYGAIHIG